MADSTPAWVKSSHSAANGNCVEVAWRKSSYSGYNGNCVETAASGGQVLVRDSKDPRGPVLAFSREDWREFTARIKARQFNALAT